MSTMNPRTFPLFSLLFIFILSLGGCKKDDLVNNTMDEIAKLATEIEGKVKNSDDKKKGVEEAQKILDGKKDDLSAKMKEVGELRDFQYSEETMRVRASESTWRTAASALSPSTSRTPSART